MEVKAWRNERGLQDRYCSGLRLVPLQGPPDLSKETMEDIVQFFERWRSVGGGRKKSLHDDVCLHSHERDERTPHCASASDLPLHLFSLPHPSLVLWWEWLCALEVSR